MIYKVETSLKCAGVCGREPGAVGAGGWCVERKAQSQAGPGASPGLRGWVNRPGKESGCPAEGDRCRQEAGSIWFRNLLPQASAPTYSQLVNVGGGKGTG